MRLLQLLLPLLLLLLLVLYTFFYFCYFPLPTYLPTYLPTCLPAYLPTCLPAYLPTCLPIALLIPAVVGAALSTWNRPLEVRTCSDDQQIVRSFHDCALADLLGCFCGALWRAVGVHAV